MSPKEKAVIFDFSSKYCAPANKQAWIDYLTKNAFLSKAYYNGQGTYEVRENDIVAYFIPEQNKGMAMDSAMLIKKAGLKTKKLISRHPEFIPEVSNQLPLTDAESKTFSEAIDARKKLKS